MSPEELIAKMRADVAATLSNSRPRRVGTPRLVAVQDDTITPVRDLLTLPLIDPNIVADVIEKEKQYPVSIAGLIQHGWDKLTGNTTYKEHRNGEIRLGATPSEFSLANAGTLTLADPRVAAGTAATALTLVPLIFGREGYNDAMGAISGVGSNIKSGLNDIVNWVKDLYSYAANYLENPNQNMVLDEEEFDEMTPTTPSTPTTEEKKEEKPIEEKSKELAKAAESKTEESTNGSTPEPEDKKDKEKQDEKKPEEKKPDNKIKDKAKKLAEQAGEKSKQVAKNVAIGTGVGATLLGAGALGYNVANSEGEEATAKNVEDYLKQQGVSTETLKAIETNDSTIAKKLLDVNITSKQGRNNSGWMNK